ncbi:MAG: ABC transporter ATP-binding protein [Desulfobacterales bacterium]|nr:ABC transporter ATP-binding protein [Desulfobacterales bacterium]
MHILVSFSRRYPIQSILMLLAMLVAAVAEGIGLSAMLPLLSAAVGSGTGGGAGTIPAAERIVREGLDVLGLPPTLEVLMLVIFFTILLKCFLILLAKKQVGYTVAQVATDYRLELLRALLASNWAFHLRQPVGALANAMTTESSRTSKAYLSGATMIIFLIQVIILSVVSFLVSWQATLAALAGGILIFYLLKRLIKKAQRAGKRQTKVMKSLVGQLVDSLQSIKPLKAMALEKLAEFVLAKETNKLNKTFRKQVLSKEYLRAFSEPLRFVFLLLGFYFTLKYLKLPVTTLMVFIFLIARILMQLGKVQDEYQKMVTYESAYSSLRNKIDEALADREVEFGTQLPVLNKGIQLKQITFAYENRQVLRNASFVFPAGLMTAIVGPSGSGKTTVADLVIGLMRPQQGQILIDDLPLDQIDMRKWRRMIGYVPQETWLLHDSVLNNVNLGDPDLSTQDAIQALQAAGAWDFVQKMSQGLNSTVGERGGKISGGQRQRIAIARALVHQPKLLILDEATTALDPENEMAICDTLRELRGRLTILAISHQPAVLEASDRAYQMQNGSAVPVIKEDSSSNLNLREWVGNGPKIGSGP